MRTVQCSAVQDGAAQCRYSARCTTHHDAAPTTLVPMLRLGSLGMMERAGYRPNKKNSYKHMYTKINKQINKTVYLVKNSKW